jgi:thiamine-monophosphate kinase
VVTTDALVEGVHFRAEDAPDLIARKALRVNLSDLAAKGARPFAYTLASVLPRRVDEAWLEAFARGLAADQEEFKVALIGGDSTATPGPITLSITALGRVASGQALLRSAARAGDLVFVSGSIGDAALGLAALMGELAGLAADAARALAERYWLPQPRPALGQALVGTAHAAIDVSDGLIADLGHIAETSGVAAEILADQLPLSQAAAAALALDPRLIERILTGGDDYEILFTAPADSQPRIDRIAAETGTKVSRIGRIAAGRGVTAIDGNGRPILLERTGYRHY